MQLFLFLALVIPVISINIADQKSKSEGQNATEIQHAICNIFTKEVVASANATITRELKGVCTSHQLETLMSSLQLNILKELTEIKDILKSSILHKHEFVGQDNTYDYIDSEPTAGNSNEDNKRHLKIEIMKFNDSVVNSSEGDIYTYYWKVERITEVLTKKNLYLSSPKFLVLGHLLQIQLYPHHLGGSTVGIQLRPDSNSFLKKHKIYVLDNVSNDDIVSGVLGLFTFNTEMYTIPLGSLQQQKFIENNVLIVKVEIYLNS